MFFPTPVPIQLDVSCTLGAFVDLCCCDGAQSSWFLVYCQDSPSLPIVMSRFCCHGALFRVIYSYVALFWVWSCVTSLFPCFSARYGCLCAFSSTVPPRLSRERGGEVMFSSPAC